MRVNIIVAVGEKTKDGYPIGKDGKLPWHDSNDLKFFKEGQLEEFWSYVPDRLK